MDSNQPIDILRATPEVQAQIEADRVTEQEAAELAAEQKRSEASRAKRNRKGKGRGSRAASTKKTRKTWCANHQIHHVEKWCENHQRWEQRQ